MTISKKAKYGLIKNREGTTRVSLYNHKPSFYPASEELLEDVNVEINDNIMTMDAKMVCYVCNWDELSYEELRKDEKFVLDSEHIVTPKYHDKFPKLFPKKYTKRWLEEKERLPFKVTANAFEIIESEEKK